MGTSKTHNYVYNRTSYSYSILINHFKKGIFQFDISFSFTDIPIIISGDTVGIIDPHTHFICEMKPGVDSSTGETFPLCEANRHKDQIAPFENLFGFTSDTSHYNGTLFRFPFRRTSYYKTFLRKELKSKISDKIFTAEEAVRELFDTLCEEASHLLLFLKSIESVELYTWDPAEKKKKMFLQISLSDSCLPHVRQFRQTCQNSCQLKQSTTILATCCVCLLSQSTQKQFNWLLCSTVGSSDAKLLELAAKLKVTPWSAVAAPLPLLVTVECIAECHLVTPQMNSETVMQTLSQHFRTPAEIADDWRPPKEQQIGYPFCFLPLKDPTGLPVQVHGYFCVSSNRRSIEWPSPGDTGEQAIWNRHLVQTSLVPSYAILLAAKSFLFTYSRSLTGKLFWDPYSWWPLEQEIRNSPVWRDILEPANLLPFMRGLKLFWSPSNGGQWIKGSDAALVTEGTPPLIVRLLISFGCPIVNLPIPVKETFNSLKDHEDELINKETLNTLKYVNVLKEVTPQYVREQLKNVPSQYLRDLKLLVTVLEYIVSDLSNDFSVLEGLPVIPVVNLESAPVSFCRSNLSWTTERIFVVTDPDVYKLLSNLKDKMISPDLPDHLTSIFRTIARSGEYTLAEATPEEICPQLISESMRKWIGKLSHRVQWTPERNGMPGKDWLKLLWKWTQKNSVSLLELEGLPIIPIQSIDMTTSSSLELVSTDFNLFCLRRPAQSGSMPEEMYIIAQTLGCTLIDHSSIFVHHTEELDQLLPTMTPQSLLSKMRSKPRIINKVMSLVNEDMNILRTFLFQMLVHISQVQLPRELLNFLKSLPFFPVGVGASSISYVSLDPTVIFPPYDTSNFPSDVHFPPTVLRVSPSDRTAYKTLIEKPESCSHFITECYGPFAMNLACAMKTKAFIWILQQYRSTRDHDLKKFLQRTEFLLSMGGVSRRADQLYDPDDETLANMFFESQSSYPVSEFRPFLPELREIGLLTWQAVKGDSAVFEMFITDRAQAIASQHSVERARTRSEKLQDYMIEIDYLSEEVKAKLKAVPFLPVKQRPADISVPWYGDSCFEASFQMYNKEHMELIFTKGVVADCKSEIYDILQFRPHPSVDDVVYHLKALHEWEKDHSSLQEEDRTFISKSVHSVYRFLDRFIRGMSSEQPLQPVTNIQLDSVWNETTGTFVPIRNLAMKSPIGISLVPYRMTENEVPVLRKYSLLWESLKIQKLLSVQDCISILEEMAVSTEELNKKMIAGIIQYLYQSNELNDEQKNSLLLPTTMSTLVPSSLCCYDDRHWNERKEGSHLLKKYTFVDSLIVSQPLAEYFGVRPISNMLGNPEILQIMYEEEGQMLPVSRRINRILTEYKEVSDVFKELIQNADDAGATEVKFLVDWRQHPIETLFKEEMKHWQGPALYAYNSSVFTDEDFKNIYELEGATKKDDTTAIGRFGLGFCTTYHITDVPSFVSKDKIIFLDPLLKYLPRDKGGGGIRFDFSTQSDVIEEFYHDQMLPFEGVFGCKILGSTVEYNGTLFRFPFRTEAQSGSELSRVTFNNQKIKEMKESFMSSAHLLPVFLQHVKKIELWELEGNEKHPQNMKMVLSVERDTPRSFQPLEVFKDNRDSDSLPQYSATEHFSVITRRMDQEGSPPKKVTQTAVCESREKWIVASALARPGSQSWNYACSHKNDGLVPLTEVAISTKEQSLIPNLHSTGHVYCFLPLPIVINDLPCVINGCFAVPSNRRTLEDLENEDQKTWNHFLIKEVLVEAYLSLLHYLTTTMPTEEAAFKESLAAYYKLWPIARLSHPVSKELRKGFLTALKSCQLPLAYIPLEQGQWLPVNQVKILEVSFYNSKVLSPIRNEVLKVLLDRGYQVAELTSDIRRSLTSEPHSVVSTFTFSTYCHDVLLSNWDVDDAKLRNNQLLYVLEHFKALVVEYEWLKELLKTTPCVPCEPDGTRCLPTTLISPEGMLKELYDVKESRFPQDRFFKSTDVKKTLIDLGMSQHCLKDEDLLDRARTIEDLPYIQAMERSNSYIRYLTAVHFYDDLLMQKHAGTFSTHTIDNPVLHQLQEIAFLPVQQRPKDTTIPWAGDNCNFAPPNSLYYSLFSHVMFTQGLIFAKIGTDIEKLFTLKVPIPDKVVDHLVAIISWVEELDDECISEANAVFLDQAMPAVYSFLCKEVQLVNSPGRMTLETKLSRLCERPCIWQRLGSKGRFLTPAQVVTYYHKAHCYPYLVKLSIENKKYLPLFEVLGVKKVFTLPSLVKVLQSIKDDMDGKPVQDTLLDFIDGISYSIGQHHPKYVTPYGMDSKQSGEYTRNWSKLTFFLPNEHGVMSEANQLAYKEDISDSSFFPAELSKGRTQYVHQHINKRDAKLLGVEDVLTSIMGQFEDNEFLKEEEFGQKEDLCTRLNNILSQYRCNVSIFKEFIQNAEDATASEIVFVVDRRDTFGERSLFADHNDWKSLQRMPSLLVFNNRKFKEKDIESIKQLGVGGKGESLDKIGRFGIGFNVAYHVTDCPMFVSYGEGGQPENFCVFDPNFHFVSKARQRRQPGARYIMKNVDGKNSSEHFQDQFAPFLGDIIPTVASTIEGCFEDYFAGWPSGFAVFRLPLTRSTNRKAFNTNLKEGHVMNVGYLQSLLRDLKSQAPSMLMFLSHLKRISVFEISKNGQVVDPWSVAVHHTENGARECAEFAQNIQEMCSKICSRNGLVTIPPSPSVTYNIEVNISKPDAPVANTGMEKTQMSSFDISGMKYSGSLSTEVSGTSLNTRDPPKHWIVSKRFGISDVPENLLYLAGGNHLFPIAGVAVPLADQRSGERFTGKLFTHLPLPLVSGIPAHINAHFWVDQSRKHLENTGSGKTEPLKDWNKVLTQQVVSRAYLEVLLKCRELVSKDGLSSVQWYYSLFLTGNRLSLTLDNFSFKDVLYQLLLESEAQVLLADELEPKDSAINWLALTANRNNPKKGWFFNGDEAVRKVLLSLGVQIAVKVANSVNLTAKCHKSVLSVEKPDSNTAYSGEVTPELARTYLRTPAQHCSVKEEVIVPALVPLLQYVLSDIPSSQECSKVDGLPLMLTSNNQFCPIKIIAPLYSEEFSRLLPNQTRYFISPLLMQDELLKGKLTNLRLVTLVTPQFVAKHIQLVKQPVVDQSQCDRSLLVDLWNYIVYMETVDTTTLDRFSEVAIIPTDQSTLVSIGMAKSVLREDGSIQLLKKLAVPVVNFSVLSNLGLFSTSKCTNLIRPRLAAENNPDEVLYVL